MEGFGTANDDAKQYAPHFSITICLGSILTLIHCGYCDDVTLFFAALAGHQVAQFYIGNAFERGGYGYATDARQAYMWYTLAMEKAVAVGDKKHKNKANTSRTTLTTGDPPFCDAECQTDAQAMSNVRLRCRQRFQLFILKVMHSFWWIAKEYGHFCSIVCRSM